jgi:hypothetical protein
MSARRVSGANASNVADDNSSWWGWEDSNFQPNDYQLLASGAAYEALSPQMAV